MKLRFWFLSLLLITIHLTANHCLLWAAANHLVISEFATHNGPSAISDEFVEIYNPTPNTVDLNNWVLQYSEGYKFGVLQDPNSLATEVIISTTSRTTIRGYGYYLIGISTGYSNSVMTADLMWNLALSSNVVSAADFPLDPDTGKAIGLKPVPTWDLLKQSNGTLILMDSSRSVIDKAGWGPAAVDYETSPCTYQGTSQQSIKRVPESDDTDNNVFDFKTSDVRCPQNYYSTAINPSMISLDLNVTPKVFSPDLGQKCIVSYNAAVNSRIKIRIYDVMGRDVRTLLNDYPGGSYSLYWDGRDDMRDKVNIGYYIIHLQSYDENGRQNGYRIKTAVVGTPLQ